MARNCKVCAREINTRGFVAEQRHRLETVGICSSCDFWAEKRLERNDPKVARINGQHYRLSQAGNLFTMTGDYRIRFYDGREVQVTGLSHQGRIPREWAQVLPDNAVFVERETLKATERSRA